MKVYFNQIYPEAGVSFNISFKVTDVLTDRLSKELAREQSLELKYGKGYKLGFVISAKKGIDDVEIKGPSISKRYKVVEYVLYLPYERVAENPNQLRGVLYYLFQGVASVLSGYNTSNYKIDDLLHDLIREISEDPDYEFREETIEIDFDEIINEVKRDRKR